MPSKVKASSPLYHFKRETF
ncbi:hypothetical protein OYC64_007484 [Pagothenia borchgrevinki]|uniref:Uncharacterized protein n=1 Tax=Pagothenia borchgrevinki TaxID=8213 RepID=A0ABD2GS50_PAGBO